MATPRTECTELVVGFGLLNAPMRQIVFALSRSYALANDPHTLYAGSALFGVFVIHLPYPQYLPLVRK